MKDHGPVPWADEARAQAARLIFPMRETAREHGYALGLHGSLARDIDVIAAPWTAEASSAETLIAALVETVKSHNGGFAYIPNSENADPHDERHRNPVHRAHGRLAWCIHLGGGPYLDVSVMPRAVARRCLCCSDALFPDEARVCAACAPKVAEVGVAVAIVLAVLMLLALAGCRPARTTYSEPWIPPLTSNVPRPWCEKPYTSASCDCWRCNWLTPYTVRCGSASLTECPTVIQVTPEISKETSR